MGTFETRSMAMRDDEAAIRFASESCVISIAPDNGPVRTIITRGSRRVNGRIYSIKGARAMPWEAEDDEPLAFEIAEVATDCLQWISQPCRVEMRDGLGGWLVYFPDLARRNRRRNSWVTRVTEIKHEIEEIFQIDGYREKIAFAERQLNSIGVEFETIENKDLGTGTFRRNVHQIFIDRNTRVEARDIGLARDVARNGAPYGELCEALGGFIHGKKRLHALMVRRVVAIPLQRVITTETPVELTDRRFDPTNDWSFF